MPRLSLVSLGPQVCPRTGAKDHAEGPDESLTGYTKIIEAVRQASKVMRRKKR